VALISNFLGIVYSTPPCARFLRKSTNQGETGVTIYTIQKVDRHF